MQMRIIKLIGVSITCLLASVLISWVQGEAQGCSSNSIKHFGCEFDVYGIVAVKYVAARLFGMSERMCLLEAGILEAETVVYCPANYFCGVDFMPEKIKPTKNISLSPSQLSKCKVYTLSDVHCDDMAEVLLEYGKGYCQISSQYNPLCAFDQECSNDDYGFYHCVCTDGQPTREDESCPPNRDLWTPMPRNCTYFAEYIHISRHETTGIKAREHCTEYGGYLASPATPEEAQCIVRLAADGFVGFWIGWTDEAKEGNYTTYEHPDGIKVLHAGAELWGVGEPAWDSNDAEIHDCVYYQESNQGAGDCACSDSRPFVCVIYED